MTNSTSAARNAAPTALKKPSSATHHGIVVRDDYAWLRDPGYQSNMPVYDKVLSDEEIVAVLSYIKNSWPEEQRGWQEEVNGTQTDEFFTKPQKPSLIEKLLK